jgi:hypothetical protein
LQLHEKFFLTFGQKSPAKDGYVLIVADDYDSDFEMVEKQFGLEWSMLYEEGDFEPEFFPKGVLKTLR